MATKEQVLVIDDSPERIRKFVNNPLLEVHLALTEDQIYFWLSARKWDRIYLDHDLGMDSWDGMSVLEKFGLDILCVTDEVIVWSLNPAGANNMINKLKQIAKDNNLNCSIVREPFMP